MLVLSIILLLATVGVLLKVKSLWTSWFSRLYSPRIEQSLVDNVKRYTGINPDALQLKQARTGRCLLSMDGGGVRGFSQLFILEEMANRIMHDFGLSELPRLCDYFDLIGGVGTGGYLAILVGRLGLTISQLQEEFEQLIARVITVSTSSEELDNFLRAVVKRYTGDSETAMFDPSSPTSHCKTFVGAVTTANVSYLTNFRSYETRLEPPFNIPIWQAARATLTHPDLFPPTQIGSDALDQVYVTGEIGWKNPSNEVIREFEALWPSQSIACLASIGSGHEGVIQIGDSSVSESIVDAMERMVTDCERIAQEVAYRFQGRDTYFRLSVEQGLQQSATRQRIPLLGIQSLTRSYMRSVNASDILNKLVASLQQSIELSPWTTTRKEFEMTVDEYITQYSQLAGSISEASVRLEVQEGVLLLEAIRDIQSSEDHWMVLAKTLHQHLNSMNRPMIMELRKPLSSSPLWTAMKDYFAEMKAVRQNLRQLSRINPHRIWGAPTHDTFLAKATTDLDKCFGQFPNAVINEIHNQVVSAKQDARFDEFISWISRLDMEKRHQDIKARRSEGTGGWLVQTPEFINWISDEAEEGCHALLGFGEPGAGKTFICCFAIEHLRNLLGKRRAALARLYFDFRDKDNQDVCAVIGELAKQLLLQAQFVPGDVWELFQKHTKVSTERAQQILALMLRSFDSTFICIDALDECEAKWRRQLLKLLTSLRRGSSLHIFCTGRFNVQTETTEILQQFFPLTVEISAHEEDIRRFIESMIEDDPHKEAMDDQLQEEITKELISRSQKLFILPALQLQFILEHVTKRKRRQALTKIPTKLFEMYQVTLSRISQQPTGQVEMAMTILSWIHLSRRKLSVRTMQYALAVQPGDSEFHEDGIPSEKALLDCCLGLVVIEHETSTIRFTHFTLQEYLNDHWQEMFPSGHSTIGSTCLTYLTFKHPDLSLLQYQKQTPLLYYAARFVDSHLREETNPGLDDRLLNLISNETEIRVLQKIVRIDDSYGSLHWAAYFGIVSLFQLVMVKTGPNYINMRTRLNKTPLGIAAERGHEAVVRLLLAAECVDVVSQDKAGGTSLSYAAEGGHEGVVMLLLEAGVDVNTRDKSGRTPLLHAARNGHEAVVKLLLGVKDVDVNSSHGSGRTPLSYAAEAGHEVIVKLLLDAEGADAASTDKSGRTSLSYAAAGGHEAVLTLLLGAGVDANAKDKSGRTPLLHAAQSGHEAATKLLLAAEGVDVNSNGDAGRTPLSYAAEAGHDGVVRLLLDADGVTVDSRNNSGRTPLSYAAGWGYGEVAKLLLDAGAEVNSRGDAGRTPLSYAIKNRHRRVGRILRDAGGVE